MLSPFTLDLFSGFQSNLSCSSVQRKFIGWERLRKCQRVETNLKNCGISCSTDGGWGEYGDWSECSAECGGGTQTRTRSCDNPVPAAGGASCKGDHQDTRECNTNQCRIGIDCFNEVDGNDYRGKIAVTKSGKKCQRWDSQYPNTHRLKSLGQEENYCRKAGDASLPWCFNGEGVDPRWELCDVPKCGDESQTGVGCWENEDRLSLGSGYTGSQNMTRKGYACQNWSTQSPNKHIFTPEEYGDKGIGNHNFCRNPAEKYNETWCYTTSPDMRWNWCEVPTCEPEEGKLWRMDLRCGPEYPLLDGTPAQCDPDNEQGFICCSPHGWCGHTAHHCSCPLCVNYGH